MSYIDSCPTWVTFIIEEIEKKSLNWLQTELQENASSIEIDLGEGNHGYLGSALIDTEYASIHNTSSFVDPQYLASLSMPVDSTPIPAL